MDEQGPVAGRDDERGAQDAADFLAVALESVGFDVGMAFPQLTSGAGRGGIGYVELGRVAGGVAFDLATILSAAAKRGIAL